MLESYNFAVDIWSCAVILGEVFLKVGRKNVKEADNTQLLFHGQHCFPLSPVSKPIFDSNGLPQTKGHILEMIFEHLGTPSKAEYSFVNDDQAIAYLKKFKKHSEANLNLKFPKISEEGLNLLKYMLQFNPLLRPTAADCLAHPYFD